MPEERIIERRKRTFYEADVTDWNDEYLAAEPDLRTAKAVINYLVENKLSTTEVARLLTIARLRGDCEERITPNNSKAHIAMGQAQEISALVAKVKREERLKNGSTISVREYVGKPGRPESESDPDAVENANEKQPKDDESFGFVHSSEPEGLVRAKRYLTNTVPGHIYSRLAIIAASKDGAKAVKEAAKGLKKDIDNMVKDLV